MSVRTRLIVGFAIATLAPAVIIVAIAISVLQYSLSVAPLHELDELSKSMEKIGRELYQRTGDTLKQDAAAGKIAPVQWKSADRSHWPTDVQEFADTSDPDRIALAGNGGDRMDYLVRHASDIWVYSASLHGVELSRIAEQYARARERVEWASVRNLGRAYVLILVALAAGIWVLAFTGVVLWSRRLTRPIRQLTKALSEVGAGRLDQRVEVTRLDEIGIAMDTFNRMADELQHSRERLVYITRLESWQALARKMAHEIKNSLTPIRLTMEEIAARYSSQDRTGFLQQATQIVVDEVIGLERRVRAFTELGKEPPVCPKPIDVNLLLEERIAFLKSAHPEVNYDVRL